MKILATGVLVLAAGVSGQTLAQETAQFTAANQQSIQANLQSGNLLAVQAAIDEACGRFHDEARDGDRTIHERDASAAEALRCVRRAKAAVVGFAADGQTRAVRELIEPLEQEAAQRKKETGAAVKFMGLSWGLGFGYSFGNDDAVDDAEIVDGIVRVNSEKKDLPRAVFEFHKYFWCNNQMKDGTTGCGPFVAVSATEDEVLSGVGMGFMYGRRTKADESEGFSIGVGLVLDGQVRDLADGFSANQAAPDGATEVRFQEKSRWSTLLFVTRTF